MRIVNEQDEGVSKRVGNRRTRGAGMSAWWKRHGYHSLRDYERDMEELDANIAQGCCFFGLIALACVLTYIEATL